MPSAPTTSSGPRERLKDLRAEWKAYNRADYQHGGPLSHIDYRLAACADRCGQCEGCYSDSSAGSRWPNSPNRRPS
jgi:hypothetical protein